MAPPTWLGHEGIGAGNSTLKDNVVLISGGTGGLGSALVHRCLEAGYRVATFSRKRTAGVDELLESNRETGRYHWQSVDGTDAAALQAFVGAVRERFEGVDVLINNAGVGRFGLFSVAPLRDIDDSLRLNVNATLLLSRLCTPLMMSRGAGNIVNVSSVNAMRGHSGVAIYSATKAALDGFTRALARELGPMKIRVNSVAPGYFESEMTAVLNEKQMRNLVRSTPLGRLGTADEIANAVLFLISNQAAFITGQTLVVDGGVTC